MTAVNFLKSRLLVFVAIVITIALASCATVLGIDDVTVRDAGTLTDASTDANVDDATGDSGATDAFVAPDSFVPVDLLQNGNFEEGCGVGWGTYNGTTAETSTTHSGSIACRICQSPTDFTLLALHQNVSKGLVAGKTYIAKAWIRDSDIAQGVPAKSSTSSLELQPSNVTQSAAGPLPSDTFQELSVSITIGDGGTGSVEYDVGTASRLDGGCVIIDDVTLFQE